jgi:hypothetical protein
MGKKLLWSLYAFLGPCVLAWWVVSCIGVCREWSESFMVLVCNFVVLHPFLLIERVNDTVLMCVREN